MMDSATHFAQLKINTITLLLGIYSVLVYYLISSNFGMKMGQSVSGLLAAQPVQSLSFTQDKESAAGDSVHLTGMPMNDSIVAGVAGDYSTLHVHCFLCASLPTAMSTGA